MTFPETRHELSVQLNEVRKLLPDYWKVVFKRKRVRYKEMCMLSDDGVYRLQWSDDGESENGTIDLIQTKYPSVVISWDTRY